jgi:transcriptional regulator GlxA family with amidase domain
MKNVAILVLESSVIQAIADPQYCFTTVNAFLQASGSSPYFQVQLVGQANPVNLGRGHYTITPDKTIDNGDIYDLIIIPALFGDINRAIALNANYIPWLQRQYQQGAELASLCIGAFLLASTGLMDGKKCSTHWSYIPTFKTMFPKVDVQDGAVICEQKGIYSSGGANAYWNLLLHLVEKYTGRQMAVLLSKYFAVDINKTSQASYAVFKAQMNHGDDAVKQAQQFIEENVEQKFTVEELAEKVLVGRRSLERRFKQATHNSVLEYIHRVKMEAAKRSLETGAKTVSEIMLDVGYADTKAFRAAFKKVTGLSPQEYKNKYSKNHRALLN